MGWLDLDSWKRAGHFHFFKGYAQPFFNVCADVDVSALYARSKQPGNSSFFLSTLYCATRAANDVEAFRLRLREGRVWRHDVVHAGSTVLRNDQTFTFADFEFVPDYAEFERRGRLIIDTVRAGTEALGLTSDEARDDLIYYSVLPWIRFTSFSNAHRSYQESVPRIVFGQHYDRDGKRWVPVSVEVHHALVDGLDVGKFLARLEELTARDGA